MQMPNATKEIEDVYITGRGATIGLGIWTEKKLKEKELTLKPTLSVIHKPMVNLGRMFRVQVTTGDPQDLVITSIKLIMDVDVD